MKPDEPAIGRPGMAAAWFLPRLLGRKRAKLFFFEGEGFALSGQPGAGEQRANVRTLGNMQLDRRGFVVGVVVDNIAGLSGTVAATVSRCCNGP